MAISALVFATELVTKKQEVEAAQIPSLVSAEFDGLCVFGLAEVKGFKSDSKMKWTAEGKTYCFRTADAKTEFLTYPQRSLARDHYAVG